MNRVTDLGTTALKLVGEFFHRMLGLSHRQAVSGHHDHLAGTIQQQGQIVRGGVFHLAIVELPFILLARRTV